MSRAIDRLPSPAHVREKKVIVTSRSRSGTFSLYQGLQMLGYRPYHMYEVVQSTAHMEVLEEAISAKYFGTGKPYGKADFDKWFADYDALVEIPAYFVDDIVAAYPHAKYIHVDRDVDKWAKSLTAVMRTVESIMESKLVKLMMLYDNYVYRWYSLHATFFHSMLGERKMTDPVAQRKMKEDYLELTTEVKRLIPKNNLAYFSLEDGFGWEQICPYLDKPIPEQPYPRGNAPKEFETILAKCLAPSFRKARAIVVTIVLIPIIGIGAWYYQSRR